MGRLTLRLPRLGETMEEAKVVGWLVAPGTAFRRGDVLLEVETDKTVVEVPALTDGRLLTQQVAAGATVALGQPIAEIEAAGEGAADSAAIEVARAPDPSPSAEPAPATARPAPAPAGTVAASPAARAAARRSGVNLALVRGTGRRGRVTAADVSASLGAAPAVHRSGGGGPPIVLLHGLFDDHRGWRDLSRRLGATGHPVLAVDLPGHGDNPAPARSLDEAARQLVAALPDGPIRLIGHSLGAAVAVRLAAMAGGRVERLLLSAPVGIGARINTDFTDGMLAAQTPAALSRALALTDAGPVSAAGLDAELARLLARRAMQGPLARSLARDGFQQIDITADLARIGADVHVLFGTADRILDWRDIANLPQAAAIHLIRGAGHLPHLAATDLVERLMTDPRRQDERRVAT